MKKGLKSYADMTIYTIDRQQDISYVPPQTSCHLPNTRQLLMPHSLFSEKNACSLLTLAPQYPGYLSCNHTGLAY